MPPPGSKSSNATCLGVAMVLAGVLAACGGEPHPPEAQLRPITKAEVRRYDLKGKVVAIDRSGKLVTVDHEEIPGFMGAMTMPYAVAEEKALDVLTVGDPITARVVTGDGPYRLEEIKVAKPLDQ